MFGDRPRGAWLAERVWEPDLPTSLVASGYEWTILDDAHFRAAAIPEADLWGPYTTEDQGQLLRVFGTEQGLRYRIPFREVDEVIGYLREHATDAGDRVGMMGDDGEKFGGWPTTWEHCWGEGRWVERFFEAIEANADWLTTTTPSAWLADHPPIGRVYIPTGSYAEMGEWALPADESLVFSKLLHEAQERRRPEARWLRGAFWRNFQVKYREINDLHKQMLRTSEAVAAMPDGPDRALAIDHLYQGQSNDCYWHGLFGGIYISHMRLATYEHLIAAEDLAEFGDGHPGRRRASRPRHGRGRRGAAGRCRAGGDGRSRRGRRHRRLGHPGGPPRAHRRHAPAPRGVPRGPARVRGGRRARRRGRGRRRRGGLDPWRRAGQGTGVGGTPRLRHATSVVPASSARSATRSRRRTGRRPARPISATPSTARSTSSSWRPVGSSLAVTARIGETDVGVTRTLTLGGDRRAPTLALELELEHRGGEALDARIGIEWSTTMLGGGGNPAAWWEVAGERSRHDAAGSATDLTTIAQGNDHIGRVRDDHDRRAGRGLVGAHRDDLEFREWLRAGLPGQRAAPLVAGPPRCGRALVADGPSRGRHDPGPRPGRVVRRAS